MAQGPCRKAAVCKHQGFCEEITIFRLTRCNRTDRSPGNCAPNGLQMREKPHNVLETTAVRQLRPAKARRTGGRERRGGRQGRALPDTLAGPAPGRGRPAPPAPPGSLFHASGIWGSGCPSSDSGHLQKAKLTPTSPSTGRVASDGVREPQQDTQWESDPSARGSGPYRRHWTLERSAAPGSCFSTEATCWTVSGGPAEAGPEPRLAA